MMWCPHWYFVFLASKVLDPFLKNANMQYPPKTITHLKPVKVFIIKKNRSTKIQKIAHFIKDMEKLKHLCMLADNVNWWSHYKNSIEGPSKTKNRTII